MPSVKYHVLSQTLHPQINVTSSVRCHVLSEKKSVFSQMLYPIKRYALSRTACPQSNVMPSVKRYALSQTLCPQSNVMPSVKRYYEDDSRLKNERLLEFHLENNSETNGGHHNISTERQTELNTGRHASKQRNRPSSHVR